MNSQSRDETANPAPIFIGGTGRSGTTFLMHALNRHPDIFSFGETKLMLVDSIRKVPENIWQMPQELREEVLSAFKKALLGPIYKEVVTPEDPRSTDIKTIEFGLFRWFSKEELEQFLPILDEMLEVSSEADAFRIQGKYFEELFLLKAKQNMASFWSEKTPTNALYLPTMIKMFPSMRFLYIVRDGRDAISSIMRTTWAQDTLKETMIWWRDSIMKFFLDYQLISPDNVKVLFFEDLLQNYRQEIENLLEFLNIPSAEEMFNIEVRKNAAGRWRSEWSEADKKEYREICGDLHERLGYSLD